MLSGGDPTSFTKSSLSDQFGPEAKAKPRSLVAIFMKLGQSAGISFPHYRVPKFPRDPAPEQAPRGERIFVLDGISSHPNIPSGTAEPSLTPHFSINRLQEESHLPPKMLEMLSPAGLLQHRSFNLNLHKVSAEPPITRPQWNRASNLDRRHRTVRIPRHNIIQRCRPINRSRCLTPVFAKRCCGGSYSP